MAGAPKTTRDQLTLVIDVLRRAKRHFWLVAIIGVVGAGLSVGLALLQKPKYSSETVLLYQEKISQSVLQGRDVAFASRTQSARYKDMLLSRTTLAAVVEEFNLYPKIVEQQGTIAAAEKLRLLVEFADRGAGTLRISYTGDTPEEAQQVTARLAALLQAKDEAVRKEQAEQTKKFLESEKAAAENALLEAESQYTAFVAKHPEFVAETATAGGNAGVGAAVRAATQQEKGEQKAATSRLATLQRAAARLKDRIANPDAPVVAQPVKRRVESPALQQAREQMEQAKNDYQDKLSKYTAKHPDVISAKNYLAEATRRLNRIEATENARSPDPVVKTITETTSVAELKEELARVEREIARIRDSAAGGTPEAAGEDSMANELVDLETEHARLQRRVQVASQRLGSLESRVFTAEITASSEFAEAAQLVIIDEAFLPARPTGKGRKIIAIAGTMLFGVIGCTVALGLALIDDRVYRRADVDELGIAPVMVVVPKQKKRKWFQRG